MQDALSTLLKPSVLAAGQKVALLRAAVEACPVNISISDLRRPDHPLIYVNPAFSKTTGYTAEQAVGRNCRFLQGPDTDPAVVRTLREAIAERRPVSVELVNYRCDGTRFLNLVELAPVRDLAAGVDAYIGIQHDVTAARQAESTRREREKLEALGRLAGGLSHELNNLLQPIVSYADLLGSRLRSSDTETAEQLAAILECAQAAGNIARSVLNFSRRAAADAAAAPARERIGDAIRFARRLLPTTITLTIEEADDPDAHCAVDGTELIQVVGNLFKNAADAMGGNGEIRVRAVRCGNELVLTIADDGPGMAPEIAARAFEPFFTTKPAGRGTGLGLSAVWGLVQGWGGRISLQTSPGNGARFVIELPLVAAPALDCKEETRGTDDGFDPAY